MYSTASNLAKLFGVSVDELVNEDLSFPGVLPLPKTYKVPLLGDIACGSPITAVEDIEAMVNVPEYIHVDFALRCKGDSMINAGIFDGDLVMVEETNTARNSEIVVALIDDSATVKTFFRRPFYVFRKIKESSQKVRFYSTAGGRNT